MCIRDSLVLLRLHALEIRIHQLANRFLIELLTAAALALAARVVPRRRHDLRKGLVVHPVKTKGSQASPDRPRAPLRRGQGLVLGLNFVAGESMSQDLVKVL